MKRLIKAAIVPDDLYVMRSADRQIDNIISGMGRPGYVLVSRQMGKTNSLLMAKRRLESELIKFVYVDLSSPSTSAKVCFRGIIDTAIDSHPGIFRDAAAKIAMGRMKADLPAHKEHERELIQLLTEFRGSLIIILDEIDALVNSSYADEIFAQIRSIYFSRVTFEPFKRLSYLLSGVVEPSQLIKDPKRSPFNIGEKIYLDDFGPNELLQLTEKAGLVFSSDVLGRIQEWTGGHPRMTWEVTSELEDALLSGQKVTIEQVDRVIQRLYLERFDLPPIDHIRELVRVDHEIRGAIRVLLSQPTPEISEQVKRRLYLAGVLRLNPDGGPISIKNRVFREALSIKWLEEIEASGDILPSKGDEQFTLGNYEAAIAFYSQFLEERSDLRQEAKWICYDQIGKCYSFLGKYSEAIVSFEKCAWQSSQNLAEYFHIRFQLGLCYYLQNHYEKSAAHFSEVATGHIKSFLRCKALLNYGAALLKLALPDSSSRAESSFRRLLDELSSVDFADLTEPAQLRLLAWFNIGQIRITAGDLVGARLAFSEATQAGAPTYAPAIALEVLDHEKGEEERKKLVSEAIGLIDKSRLRFSDVKLQELDLGAALLPYSYDLFLQLLAFACQMDLSKAALALVDHGIAMGSLQGVGRCEILYALTQRIRKNEPKAPIMLLLEEARHMVGEIPDASSSLAREVIGSLLVEKAGKGVSMAKEVDDFRQCIAAAPPSLQLTDVDYHAFVFAAIALRTRQQYSSAIGLCADVIIRSRNGGEAATRNLFIAYFFDAQIKWLSGWRREAYQAALTCKQQIESIGTEAGSVLGAAGLSEIRKGVERIILETQIISPIRHSAPKAGRNDPCPCGSGKKYKKCHGA